MQEWETLQRLGVKEMESLSVGTRVRLNFLGNPEGEIIDTQPPVGILAPRYKCRWDNGDESGYLLASQIAKLKSFIMKCDYCNQSLEEKQLLKIETDTNYGPTWFACHLCVQSRQLTNHSNCVVCLGIKMICPNCSARLKVIDARPTNSTNPIPLNQRRRRVCLECDYKMITYEVNANDLIEYVARVDKLERGVRVIRKFKELILDKD